MYLLFQNFILGSFKQNCRIGVIFTNFEKAFEHVDHDLRSSCSKCCTSMTFCYPILSPNQLIHYKSQEYKVSLL